MPCSSGSILDTSDLISQGLNGKEKVPGSGVIEEGFTKILIKRQQGKRKATGTAPSGWEELDHLSYLGLSGSQNLERAVGVGRGSLILGRGMLSSGNFLKGARECGRRAAMLAVGAGEGRGAAFQPSAPSGTEDLLSACQPGNPQPLV